MQHSFKNKIVLVTGGTSGIGLAIAKRFVEEGAQLIICGRDSEKGALVCHQLAANYKTVTFIKCDIGIPQEIDSLFQYINGTYHRLDIAVNNASVFCMGKVFHEYTLEEFNQAIQVNLTGTFLCMKAEIGLMLAANHGNIVNILSNASVAAQTYGSTPYIASKHGEAGLTRVAALEYATRGIRVNGILPGLTDTDMLRRNVDEQMMNSMISKYPMKRLVQPEEIAEAVLFLSSEAASALNGVLLPVDEGKSART